MKKYSLQTVLPDTLELLKTLMLLPELKDMRLVGGTSLALQYGHRRSVDLDFFGNTTDDTDELTAAIKKDFIDIYFLLNSSVKYS